MFDPNKWLKQKKVTTLTPVDEKVSSHSTLKQEEPSLKPSGNSL